MADSNEQDPGMPTVPLPGNTTVESVTAPAETDFVELPPEVVASLETKPVLFDIDVGDKPMEIEDLERMQGIPPAAPMTGGVVLGDTNVPVSQPSDAPAGTFANARLAGGPIADVGAPAAVTEITSKAQQEMEYGRQLVEKAAARLAHTRGIAAQGAANRLRGRAKADPEDLVIPKGAGQ